MKNRLWHILRTSMQFTAGIMAIVLVFSVVYCGFHYSFYGDELVHMNTAYLVSVGKRPFIDFFTIYSPLFHVLLVPIFRFTGYTFQAVSVARVIMIVVFFARLLVGWLFVSTVFSRRVATLFVLLLLLDPFTVFSGMQIRPDSLYLFVLFLGLYFLSLFLKRHQQRNLFFAGLCIGLAVVFSVKSLAVVGVLSLFLFFYLARMKRVLQVRFYLLGAVIPLALFCGYFILQGSFTQMTEHLIVYSKAMSDGLWYPTRLGFFYIPGNTYIYGLGGKPVTWYIAIGLPILAVFGALFGLFSYKKHAMRLFWVGTLFCIALAQYCFFYTVRSMFMQYYLGVNWILAVFTAVFLDICVRFWKTKALESISETVYFFLFLLVVTVSIQANMLRATAVSMEIEDQRMLQRWSAIPADEPVFPGLLFRPLSQPIPYGYFYPEVPQRIRSGYLPVKTLLETNAVRYLLVGDYTMQFFDSATVAFIRENYVQDHIDSELWVRNNTQ